MVSRDPNRAIGWMLLLIILAFGCAGDSEPVEVRRFVVEDLEGVVEPERVAFDQEVTSDGNGSFRIAVADTTTIRLYELDALQIEDALLTFNADLRCEELIGNAYLEIVVRSPRGEYFMRSYRSPLSGTSDWTRRRTGYLFRPDERPDRVRLNLIVQGSGTVWIDNIVLEREKAPKPSR